MCQVTSLLSSVVVVRWNCWIHTVRNVSTAPIWRSHRGAAAL
ncbi:hypothetical protein [Nonomuraea sp. NPDC003804]